MPELVEGNGPEFAAISWSIAQGSLRLAQWLQAGFRHYPAVSGIWRQSPAVSGTKPRSVLYIRAADYPAAR